MRLFSFDPKKGKQVPAGEFDSNSHIFEKKVKSVHYMIKERGYGISEDVIQQLIALECQDVRIITKKVTFLYSFEELLLKPIKNYGSGEQRFLKVIKEVK